MTGRFPTSASVVIIGGGVMGASTAYHLALRGIDGVVLLDREPFFGMGATGKCAGGIRYQFSTEINVRLSQMSLPMLDRFEEELGQVIDLRKCGYLFLLTNERDAAQFRTNVELQQELGVDTQWLSGDEARKLVPQIYGDDIIAGTFNDQDGLVDPNSVVSGYVKAARRHGVQALNDTEIIDVQIESGRVQGVVTPDGKIACDTLVNAAGPWSAQVSAMLGIPLPVTPVRRQMLTTTPIPDLNRDFPFVIDFERSLYFHREGEGLLTGMSNPYQEPGYDESIDKEWELVHLEAAILRLPLLASASKLTAWAGLYEITPDAHPIIGPVKEVEGYYVVTGFSGHGFMHGPAAGLLLAEMIVDGHPSSLDISKLDYERFSEGREIREYNVV